MKENEHESEGEVLLCLSLSLLSAYLPPVDDVPGRRSRQKAGKKQAKQTSTIGFSPPAPALPNTHTLSRSVS